MTGLKSFFFVITSHTSKLCHKWRQALAETASKQRSMPEQDLISILNVSSSSKVFSPLFHFAYTNQHAVCSVSEFDNGMCLANSAETWKQWRHSLWTEWTCWLPIGMGERCLRGQHQYFPLQFFCPNWLHCHCNIHSDFLILTLSRD